MEEQLPSGILREYQDTDTGYSGRLEDGRSIVSHPRTCWTPWSARKLSPGPYNVAYEGSEKDQ